MEFEALLNVLIEFIKTYPKEVLPVAMGVYLLILLLKQVNVVKEDNFARLTNLLMSFLAGGGLTIGNFDEALYVGGLAFGAGLLHHLFETWIPALFKIVKAKRAAVPAG